MNTETYKENASFLVPRTKAASRKLEKSFTVKISNTSSIFGIEHTKFPRRKKKFTVLFPYRNSRNREYKVQMLHWGKLIIRAEEKSVYLV